MATSDAVGVGVAVPGGATRAGVEAAASFLLRWPLSAMLAALCFLQLALWGPQYLSWPFSIEHDLYANQALGWESGLLPYRDTPDNNFPGQMYLLCLLGKTAGWGRPWAIRAVDAGLLTGTILLMLAWSRRRLGGSLPGLVGSMSLLGYYLEIGSDMAAQRDAQGPMLMASAIFLVQLGPGRAGRSLSALVAAVGFVIRPQVVLFLPALAIAILADMPAPPTSGRRAAPRLGLWLAVFLGAVALMFVPLIAAGVGRDFLAGLLGALPGGGYSRSNPLARLRVFFEQFGHFGLLAVAVGNGLLIGAAGPELRRTAWPWLAALLGASIYKPLSPIPHAYLGIPLMIAFAVNSAVLARLVLGRRAPESLLLVLLILGLQAKGMPRYSSLPMSLYSLRHHRPVLRGEPLEVAPLGAWERAREHWDDFRRTVEYLREKTGPATRVASVLRDMEPINSTSARVSAFPTAGIAWLAVRPRALGEFIDRLEATPDSVVVWSPSDTRPMPVYNPDAWGIKSVDTAPLARAIERLYRPEARFGSIEVWRRKPPIPAGD